MTTHDNFLNPSPKNPSEQDTNLSSQSVTTPQVSAETPVYKVKQRGTLRRRLLMTVLPTTLIPLLVASAIGINITQRQAEEEKLIEIEQQAILSREMANKFLQDALDIKYQLEANPLVIEAIESGTEQVQSQGLLNKNIEQVEQQFASNKLLTPNQTLNNYLKAMTKTQDIAEVILTEENGFNIAYSSPSSDFVQSDEEWWQIGREKGQQVLGSTFDDSTETIVIETVSPLNNPNSDKVLGVAKVSVSTAGLEETLAASVGIKLSDSEALQIIDGQTGNILNTLTSQSSSQSEPIIGGEPVAEVAKIFTEAISAGNIEGAVSSLQEIKGISNVELQGSEKKADLPILTFRSQGRFFKIVSIPDTNFLATMSVEKAEIAKAGDKIAVIFASTSIVLALLATGVILLLARNLSRPLATLANKAQQVADGDLNVQAELQGTQETQTVANNFNNLVKQVNTLIKEQATVAEEHKQEKEKLEQEIYQLVDEVEGALDGDLTVRASLSSMEMSTVADLFNAIIDNLKDTAVQVKDSSTKVSSSLGENEQSIQQLAYQAIQEAEATRKTLGSVEQMSHSIEAVAANANQAATLAD
ncbi:MAG: methyl-accepting chemotaxis protein, partial [Cyanobacteria bacterium P01_G01_bin.49]